MTENLLVISIWKTDPVGGEFIDWPDTPEDAYIDCEAEFQEFLLSENVQALNLRSLQSLAGGLSEAWTPHHEVSALIDDLDVLLKKSRHSDSDQLVEALLKIKSACHVAGQVDEAGVYIS